MPFLRPGQGFKRFTVLRKSGTISAAGSVGKSPSFSEVGEIIGILVGASQKEKEQFKQDGHPISHKIIQRGVGSRGKATEYIRLTEPVKPDSDAPAAPLSEVKTVTRYFYIQGTKNPAEWDHELIYYVEERADLNG